MALTHAITPANIGALPDADPVPIKSLDLLGNMTVHAYSLATPSASFAASPAPHTSDAWYAVSVVVSEGESYLSSPAYWPATSLIYNTVGIQVDWSNSGNDILRVYRSRDGGTTWYLVYEDDSGTSYLYFEDAGIADGAVYGGGVIDVSAPTPNLTNAADGNYRSYIITQSSSSAESDMASLTSYFQNGSAAPVINLTNADPNADTWHLYNPLTGSNEVATAPISDTTICETLANGDNHNWLGQVDKDFEVVSGTATVLQVAGTGGVNLLGTATNAEYAASAGYATGSNYANTSGSATHSTTSGSATIATNSTQWNGRTLTLTSPAAGQYLQWDGSTFINVTAAGVSGSRPDLVRKMASANIRHSNTTEYSQASGASPPNKFGFTFTNGLTGTIRVKYDAKSANGGQCWFTVYKKTAAGVQTTLSDIGVTSTTYATQSFDTTQTFAPGDKLEFRFNPNSGNTAWVKNFYICYDDSPEIVVPASFALYY